MSLSLAGGASAANRRAGGGRAAARPDTAPSHEIILSEEEISDVSLATFYVFDKESAGTPEAR